MSLADEELAELVQHGDTGAGDEIICLTRAFIYAGARSVIVTLWPIEDQTTAELMEKFYRHLTRGETKSRALQEAQLMITEKYHNPYLWAGFQLFGDYE